MMTKVLLVLVEASAAGKRLTARLAQERLDVRVFACVGQQPLPSVKHRVAQVACEPGPP